MWQDEQQRAGLAEDVPEPTTSRECRAARAVDADFLSLDLSWLEFNRRVLHEATDPRTPLLKRARFLDIFRSNLDEFFMKRMDLVRRRGQQTVRSTIVELLQESARAWTDVAALLADHGIRLLDWRETTDVERTRAAGFFREHPFPVLTPLSVDPGHPSRSSPTSRSRSACRCGTPARRRIDFFVTIAPCARIAVSSTGRADGGGYERAAHAERNHD
jgi:hypothetical protein